MAAIGHLGPVDVAACARPTKLFIGGVSRHTTTKQLRDHFSQHGKVLDCVAMRQPDGRSRGFGYVTLDSVAAAERCLLEPQIIDGRVLDMKLAVPEGSAGVKNGVLSNFDNFSDFPTGGLHTASGFFESMHGAARTWPDTLHAQFGTVGSPGDCFSPMSGSSWWAGYYGNSLARTTAPLDCLDLLVRDEAAGAGRHAQPQLDVLSMLSTSPTAQQMQGQTQADVVSMLSTRSSGQLTLARAKAEAAPDATIKPPTPTSQTMSATAPCFVPKELQAENPEIAVSAKSDYQKANLASRVVRSRTPLGELTNVAANIGDGFSHDSILKTKKFLGTSLLGTDPMTVTPCSLKVPMFREVPSPLDVAVDHECSGTNSAAATPASSTDPGADEHEEEQSVASSCEEEDDQDITSDVLDAEGLSKALLEGLPSRGSALHASGECRRCNFFPKGRCQNGIECPFCHLPHEKRKPTRQEKRERKAAWLQQQQESEGHKELAKEVDAAREFPQESQLNFQHAHHLVDEELCATSSEFLGLPPVLASTPAGLPLSVSPAVAELTASTPPGLSTPEAYFGILGDGLLGAAYGGGFFNRVADDADEEETTPGCLPLVLATTPTSLSSPMAWPTMSLPATPTDVLATTPAPNMDYTVSSRSDKVIGNTWARNELLRIRGAMEVAKLLAEDGASLSHRAVWRSAISATA